MAEDIHTKFLKHVEKFGLQGISYEEAEREFGPDVKHLWLSAVKSNALTYNQDHPHSGTYEGRWLLTLEGKYKLLDHSQLVAANKASRLATLLSIAAIIISLVAAAWQVFTPTTISPDQIDTVIRVIETNTIAPEELSPTCALPFNLE